MLIGMKVLASVLGVKVNPLTLLLLAAPLTSVIDMKHCSSRVEFYEIKAGFYAYGIIEISRTPFRQRLKKLSKSMSPRTSTESEEKIRPTYYGRPRNSIA